ncbi:hypothetical protein RJ639_003550, partial [Escallonia herrerae]
MGLQSCLLGVVPFAAMVATEFTDVGMATISKAAMTQGMSNLVFVVYYNAIGTIILFPFLVSRSLAQILAFAGLKDSSPTLSSAIGNLNPIFTFLLAIIFRMEKLDLRSSTGLAVSLGAVVSVSGAFIVTLYKGPQFLKASSFPPDFPRSLLHSQDSTWIVGGLLLATTCFLTSIWNVFMVTTPAAALLRGFNHAATVKVFPEKITIIFFLCFFSTILCGTYSLIVERNLKSWKLRADMEMIAILYSAIFAVVFRNGVYAWCLQDKGPVYVAMFKPLAIVIAVVTGVLFLGETLYIGSVIGAIIITLGFYTVMWGKGKERSLIPDNGVDVLESCSEKRPLLHHGAREEVKNVSSTPEESKENKGYEKTNVCSSIFSTSVPNKHTVLLFTELIGLLSLSLYFVDSSDSGVDILRRGLFCATMPGKNYEKLGLEKSERERQVVGMEMGMQSCIQDSLPFAAMVIVECGEIGMITLGKAAMNSGMSNLVYVVYYNTLGTLMLLPFFIIHSHRICVVQVCSYAGINYSSPTLAAAMGNLIPAFTFLLAIIFSRTGYLEAFFLQSLAFVLQHGVSFSKICNCCYILDKLQTFDSILFANTLTFFLQTATVKEYPDQMTLVFFFCCFGTIQCAILTLIVERNPGAWVLHPGIETIAIVFAAIFASVFRIRVITWCLCKKGPVYVAMFKPIGMVIAVIMGNIFLGDTLHLGSVIGAVIIALGFYTVMWGKAKEKNTVEDTVCGLESSTENTPLLARCVTEQVGIQK